MLKRILLYFACLLCVIGNAEEIESSPLSNSSEIGKWREFVGVNVGAGLYDIGLGYIFWFNTRLAGYAPSRAFGGNIAITTGKQKYTYEKVGWRYLFALRADYMNGWKYRDDENFNLKSGWGLNATFAIDGLFDFVRENNSSFGMILGIGFELFDLKIINTDSKNAWSVTTPLTGSFRLGFKGQFDKNVVDLVLSIPCAGGISISGRLGTHIITSSTLTLGYKYLF